MPSTLPPWLRTLSAVTGVCILAAQAAGHLLFAREPNLLLLVAGAVMVGLVSPDKIDRFLPGGDGNSSGEEPRRGDDPSPGDGSGP